MIYHQLGKSTLEISEIGFGCMSIGKNAQENQNLVDRAIELGINFFDTADMYDKGANEIMLGNLIKEKRQQLIIATKVGNVWRSDNSGWDWNPRKDHILAAVEESLRRLQTEYIDLYQLHGGTIEDPIDETIEAFEMLKQQGKIRFYGISSIRPNVIKEYVDKSNIVSVMMQFSLLDRRPEEACLQLLQENNIGVLARGGLAKGLLVDKPADKFLNYSPGEVQAAATAIRSLVGPDRSASQTALRLVLSNTAITSAVVGLRTVDQLEDVARTPDTPKLWPEGIDSLTNSLPANFYDQHK